jgi:4-hydroxymandelate oxidase
MTRREAIVRASAGAALALAGGTAIARQPASPVVSPDPVNPPDQAIPLDHAIPPGVVTLEDFEALARQRLSARAFESVRGGAADEISMRWNREAFNRMALRPRVMVDVSRLDTRLTLFGQSLACPILLAPAGVHGLLHPQAELATARGASKAGALLVIPDFTTHPVEEIVRAATPAPWFQLYIGTDRGAAREKARRAEAAGCKVLIVTVDGAAAGVRNSLMRPPFNPVATPGELRTGMDTSLSWKDIAWLKSFVRIPIVLKGIIDPRDAERAVAEGVAGISVSNHGGRTLDTAAATIDALPAVVEKVAGRIPVMLDGGVRRGTDVLKALARGASAVMIGRPFLYGLGAAGADGVERVVTILRQEFEMAMALTGRASLAAIDQSVLW